MQLRPWQRIAAGIITGLLLFLFPASALADRGSDLQYQIDQINARNAQTRSQLDTNRAQQNDLLAQMADLDRKIIAVTAEIDRLTGELNAKIAQRAETERQIATVQSEIAKTIAELEAAKKRLAQQQRILNERLKGIYQGGKKTYLQVVLVSSSFSDFVNRMSFLKFIASQDHRILNQVKETKALIEAKEAQLEKEKALLERERLALIEQERSIAQLRSAQETSKLSLQQEQGKRQVLVARLQQDEGALRAAAEQEAADVERLTADLRAWNVKVEAERARGHSSRGSGRTNGGSGGWVWPVGTMADITSGFGWRNAPAAGASSFHQGIDIAVPYGTPVVAANSGVVSFTGYYGGFGLFIVVDHGNGLSSSYAHLSDIAVSPGESVAAGQVIGYVGSTGVSTGPHLDFRIYVDGVAENPLNWF